MLTCVDRVSSCNLQYIVACVFIFAHGYTIKVVCADLCSLLLFLGWGRMLSVIAAFRCVSRGVFMFVFSCFFQITMVELCVRFVRFCVFGAVQRVVC